MGSVRVSQTSGQPGVGSGGPVSQTCPVLEVSQTCQVQEKEVSQTCQVLEKEVTQTCQVLEM